jgi:long-chain-fatty-acid--[acyl-carrier-protein] ligase
VRLVLAVRYRITYRGVEAVKSSLKKDAQGILFLPNHPTVLTDPLIVCLPFMVAYDIRPLVTEEMFFNPLFYPLLRWIRALPVPNFATGTNSLKIARLEKTLAIVEEGLARGESFLIYPAGMTKQSSREILGGTFAVPQLLAKFPETQVVLTRTVGLWGSRFSRAYTKGQQISLSTVCKQSFKDLLKGLVFFLPKRQVTVDYEVAPQDMPKKGPKNVLNRYLENWYNLPFLRTPTRGEPLTYIPYSRWKETPPVIEEETESEVGDKIIPKEIEDEIVQKIAELANVPVESVTRTKHLVADLNLDSLNIAELITYLEIRFDIQQVDPQLLGTVASVLLAATQQVEKVVVKEPDWDTTAWNTPRKPERLLLGEGSTIPDVFFDVCDRYLHETIASDNRTGAVSYYFIKSRVMLMYRELKKLPGKHIGILLPASLTTTTLVLACHLAGKVPVMINWTVGGRHLESVVQLSGIKVVLTSWTVLDRLENVDLRPIQNMLVVLEELRATFSWMNMALAPIKALLPSRWLRKLGWMGKWWTLKSTSDAVILFTSGTESMPKGVPLTHKNLISNMRAALLSVEFYSTDRLLCSLPPFHSFGFSVTGLLPLLAGARVVYAPNPADPGLQLRMIRKWEPTIVCSAPSFLLNILRQAQDEPLESLRLVVSGAERAPSELIELCRVAAPQAAFIEGYGITECSPIIAINNSSFPSTGVGKPLAGVRIKIVNPENFQQVLPSNQPGMILVSGPNVFRGYLQTDVKSPFFEDGIPWYITGDIGSCDEHGNLQITGRLKRFVKIGGEMISLGAIEAALSEDLLTGQGEGPQLAISAKGESEGRPRLILFTTKDIPISEVNGLLRHKGFSSLVKIDRVVCLETIPLTGTGKIAHRELETACP